ncbi:MAG: hypothetical protein H6560_18995 [Lewinellaceae bacterium]|nr:hypothetical protein [Lewinellaceae bacterium]
MFNEPEVNIRAPISFQQESNNMRYLIFFLTLLFTACNGGPPSSSHEEQPSADTLANPAASPERDTAEKERIGNLLKVEKPLPNQNVASPLGIEGRARGYWFFEGSFPVTLLDKDYKTLATGNAEAQGNWMTEDFVPFRLTLEFESPGDERGYLRFEKANPSGLPENDREFRFPVIFR